MVGGAAFLLRMVGGSEMIAAITAVGTMTEKMGKELVTKLSYEVEYQAKRRAPVWSGRLFSSIGNKVSASELPVPLGSPSLNSGEQSKGRSMAIWRRRKVGGEWEVETGTKVQHDGNYYAPTKEYVESSGPYRYGYEPKPHFMEDGAKAALNNFDFDSLLDDFVATPWVGIGRAGASLGGRL